MGNFCCGNDSESYSDIENKKGQEVKEGKSSSSTAVNRLVSALATEEGKAELKSLFQTLDHDRDGKVSAKEWGSGVYRNKAVMAKFFGGCSIAEIGKAFARIDADGNDQLTWEEFIGAANAYGASMNLVKAMSTPEGKADLRALFDALDKDHDGKVSSKEWGKGVYKNQEVMRKYFGGNTISELGKAFKRIDSDGDGELTWAEFVTNTGAFRVAEQLGVAMRLRGAETELKQLFDELRNEDGVVTSRTWGHAVGSHQQIMSRYFGGSSIRDIAKAFSRIDRNSDKELTWREFKNAANIGLDSTVNKVSSGRKLIQAMATEEGRQEFKQLFSDLDTDNSGEISSKEWGRGLRENKEIMAKYFGGSTMAEVGQAFNKLDVNHDGSITWEEFSASTSSAILDIFRAMEAPEDRAELKSLFHQLDSNCDGTVSLSEWGVGVTNNEAMMKRFFGGKSKAEVGKAFSLVDLDGNQSLTWEEFQEAVFLQKTFL